MIQLISCTGRRYLLHLLPPEVNRQRGLGEKRHRLVIQLHPVLMFQNELMEELTYLSCIASRCCHLALRPEVLLSCPWRRKSGWSMWIVLCPTQAWTNTLPGRLNLVGVPSVGGTWMTKTSIRTNQGAEQA